MLLDSPFREDLLKMTQNGEIHATLSLRYFIKNAAESSFTLTARVKCEGKTGVEMEALSAVSVGLLTIYDMLKAIDKGMHFENIRLLSKKGGKSGEFKALGA